MRLEIQVRKGALIRRVLYFDVHRSVARNVDSGDENTMAFILDSVVVEGSGFVEGVKYFLGLLLYKR